MSNPGCVQKSLLVIVAFVASTMFLGATAMAEEKSGPAIKIGGYVKLDFIQDFDPIGNASQFKTNSIPVAGTPESGQGGQTAIQARETRLTLTLLEDTPRGQFKAYVEGDFYGDHNTFRIRHAYGVIGELLGGQTWTTFMDINSRPRSLDYEGPDAEIFVRQAMVRWTRPLSDNWTFAIAAEQPGGQFVTPDTLDGSARTNVPDLPANIRYAGDRGHVQISGMVRQIRFDGETGTASVSTSGYGGNVSFRLNTKGKSGLMGEVAFGKGIGRYVESFSGENVDAVFVSPIRMETLEVIAGVLAYEQHWNDRTMSSVSVSQASLQESTFLSPSAIKRTTDARANLIWAAYKKVDIGGEILWGERENQNGASGDAWRFQFSMIYKLI